MGVPFVLGKPDYFVVDSNNVGLIDSEMYGFSLGASDIAHGGAFVAISREDHEVVIEQDFLGSYGLYLYEDEFFFAVSNSFQKLVEHLAPIRQLTLNDDFVRHFVLADLCSISCEETMVKEIRLLPRNTFVSVNLATLQLAVRVRADYGDNSIPVDTPEGILLLDHWFEKWTKIIRGIWRARRYEISADLSGGFDSRITLCLLLGAGIDMGDLRVNSIEDRLHTHAEDYRISSAIASHYGFQLNVSPSWWDSNEPEPFSLREALDISFYAKSGVHKQLGFKASRSMLPRFNFTGSGGECLRAYWNEPPMDYQERNVRQAFELAPDCAAAYALSMRNIIENSFQALRRITGGKIEGRDLTQSLYKETRCRFHFGRDAVESYFANDIKCTPLIDADLFRLRTNGRGCSDKNLLVAIIFDRYQKELLQFPFEGGRKIEEATLEYARALNRKFPPPSFPEEKGEEVAQIVENASVPPVQTSEEPTNYREIDDCVRTAFESCRERAAFSLIGSDAVYMRQHRLMQRDNYRPLQHAYPCLAATGVAAALDSKGGEFKISSYMQRMAWTKSAVPDESFIQNDYLRLLATARIDVKNHHGSSESGLALLSAGGGYVSVSNPRWFCRDGNEGYVFEGFSGRMELSLRALMAGTVSVEFRSKNAHNAQGAPSPVLVDYTLIEVNGRALCDERMTAWHDDPIKCDTPVHSGDLLTIRAVWGPHNCVLDKQPIAKGAEAEVIEKPAPPTVTRLLRRGKARLLRILSR